MITKLLRERSRARAVRALRTGDHPTEPNFDRFVQQVADAFASPIALLTLVDDASLWIRAGTGMATQCMPREHSFCSHAVERCQLTEVCDARVDPVFATLPVVTGAPFVRYYMGAPLIMIDGTAVGALCVVDVKPRIPASLDQRAYLTGVARQAAQALERRAHVGGMAA